MTHVSLFTGIGGIDLAAEWAGFTTIAQVERDDYCCRVLERHWPTVHRCRDIRDFPDRDYGPVTLVSGGFPCQDVSVAGLKAGIDGEQSGLWREMFRVVCDIRPQYVLVENVPGLYQRGLGTVLGDLAGIGFNAEWGSIRASDMGAHFVGQRVFIVATPAEAGSLRWERGGSSKMGTHPWGRDKLARLVRVEMEHGVPAGSHGRISDGLPNRAHRLRALGNAVVPQQVYPILKAIADDN